MEPPLPCDETLTSCVILHTRPCLHETETKRSRRARRLVLHGMFVCRYEGEFVDNKMQGYGVYVWRDGT